MSFNPFLQIRKFWYADETRSTKKRLPGACKQLLNFAPNISDGLSVRRGYYGYGDVTFPNNYEILKTVPIQSPEQEDVHVFFCNDSGQKIKIQPTWRTGATGIDKITDNINIAEDDAYHAADGNVTSNVLSLAVTTPVSGDLVATDDYYNGWVVKNVTSLISGAYQYALVTDYTTGVVGLVGNCYKFTLVEDVQTLGWQATDEYEFQRYAHDNFSFAPAYNTTKESQPSVTVRDSVVRISGGQSSASGNKPSIVFPRLTREYFPAIAEKFTYDGTYVSERRCKPNDFRVETYLSSRKPSSDPIGLGYTFWLGLACVYDGYQIGELQRYEAQADYNTVLTETNYFNLYADEIDVTIGLSAGSMNKRITAVRLYMSLDNGDTRTTGRVTPYFFIKEFSLIRDDANWQYVAADGKYEMAFTITNTVWSARGNTFLVDAGFLETTSDTCPALSGETTIETRNLIYNYYCDSESLVDRQKIIANPVCGAADVALGAYAKDIFPNEEPDLRIGVEPTIGTKINAIIPVGISEALVLKDKGVVATRFFNDRVINHQSSVLSNEIGCATFGGYVIADDKWIYFAGYEDIYRSNHLELQPLIEREDANDWLAYYRGSFLTNTYKQNCTIWYLPQNIIYFDFGFNGGQFAYYPRYGAWMQVAFQQDAGGSSTRFFKWMTTLQDGTVLGTIYDSGGTLFGVMRFQDSSGAMYLTDNTTAIQPKLDTGDLIVTQDIAKQFLLDKITITRTFDTSNTPSGTLDCSLYLDGTLLKTYGDIMKGNSRIIMHTLSDDKKLALSFRLGYNTNASPEVLNTGDSEGQLAIDEIAFYGEPRVRHENYAEQTVPTLSTGGGESVAVGLISGKDSVIVNSTPTAFTWDTPFTQNTTDANSNVIPAYRFWQIMEDDNTLDFIPIKVIAKTLTTITLQAPQDNVLVRFRAEE